MGHIIGGGHLKPLPDNVTKILNIKVPNTKKQVKSIIGLVNYYAKFVPDIATILILLPFFNLTATFLAVL